MLAMFDTETGLPFRRLFYLKVGLAHGFQRGESNDKDGELKYAVIE